MRPGNISSYVPQVRPHNKLRDGGIFFLISKRPLLELSGEEKLLYESMDGRRSVAELEMISPGACDLISKWHEAAILELIPPITSPAKPHLVVIEPHMDDAVLSAGGRLLHRRGQCRITILSVVKWSNFTSYLLLKRDSLSVQEITDLRLAESALVARLLGAEHRCLDWTDAPLRFWPNDWSPAILEKYSIAPHAFVNLFPNPRDVLLLADQLQQQLMALAPDELWIPMGLGDHVDHRITRSACLAMLASNRERFSRVPVFMYEDLPYASRVGHADEIRAALMGGGMRLVSSTEDITDVLEEKVRVASVYASQFKQSFIEPIVRNAAHCAGGSAGKLAESYHRIVGKIDLLPESHFCRGSSGLVLLRKKVRTLLPERKKCGRLTVIAVPSGHLGWWASDRKSLVFAFPNADIHVHASADLAWQANSGGISRLRLEAVRGGWKGWVGVISRELFRFGTPTVVVWQGAYGTRPLRMLKMLINLLMKYALPFRPVLFAKTLCDFCGILNEELDLSAVSKLRDVPARTACESAR